jgi:protein-S-isoprenylcysteine O-methyltransferase Ste14
MVIGLPLNSGLYWGVAMVPFYIVTMNRLVIEREEMYLGKKFKDAYSGYVSRVRRWI